jgi:glycosyltransferase involved in cell wall biosynthesis
MPTLENLMLLGFQPYERLSEVLASSDVLIATLESDAGQFAVPSKILTYLCAGRPVLLAAPRENLAASVIERSGGGVVTDPDDLGAWVAAAKKLALDRPYREELGVHARRYAESAFDIHAIAGVFENVLNKACRNDTYRARVA